MSKQVSIPMHSDENDDTNNNNDTKELPHQRHVGFKIWDTAGRTYGILLDKNVIEV